MTQFLTTAKLDICLTTNFLEDKNGWGATWVKAEIQRYDEEWNRFRDEVRMR